MQNDMPVLRIVTSPGSESHTIEKTVAFLDDYFCACGWQVQHLQVATDVNQLLTNSTGVHRTAAFNQLRTLSLTPFYSPTPGEYVVYWLFDSTLPSLRDASPAEQERCSRNFCISKVLSSSIEGRKILQSLVRHVEVLSPPPFVIRDILPGSYRQALVLEAANGVEKLAGTALTALPQLRHSAPLQLQLAGFTSAPIATLQQELASRSLQVSVIKDVEALTESVRYALAYVVIGMRGTALEVRAEIAAAARKPLLVFGSLDADQLDFFANGVTGFQTSDANRLMKLLDLLAGGKIDASRLGENAFRLLLSKRQPERTLKEYLQ